MITKHTNAFHVNRTVDIIALPTRNPVDNVRDQNRPIVRFPPVADAGLRELSNAIKIWIREPSGLSPTRHRNPCSVQFSASFLGQLGALSIAETVAL
jgi:hypothetical protein